MVLHAWEQWQAAAMAYERARTLAPRNTDWPYLAAVVALRSGTRGRRGGAARGERRGADAERACPPRMKLAEALLNAGDLTRSAEVYAGARARTRGAAGSGVRTRTDRGAARADWKQPRSRISSARASCSRSSARRTTRSRSPIATRAGWTTPSASWSFIGASVRAGRRSTIRCWRVNALKDDARARPERGIRFGNEGKLADAIAAHDAALAKDPDNCAGPRQPDLAARTPRPAGPTAEKHFKAVVALKSNLDEAYYNYGVVLTLQKRDAEAADAFRQAIDVNPLHAQAHNNLGVLFERERRWEDAAGAYRRALEGQPAFRLGRFNLGRMLIALGRNDDAVTELEKLRDARGPGIAALRLRAGDGASARGTRRARARLRQQARRLALAHDQSALAAAIDKDLAALAAARRP